MLGLALVDGDFDPDGDFDALTDELVLELGLADCEALGERLRLPEGDDELDGDTLPLGLLLALGLPLADGDREGDGDLDELGDLDCDEEGDGLTLLDVEGDTLDDTLGDGLAEGLLEGLDVTLGLELGDFEADGETLALGL